MKRSGQFLLVLLLLISPLYASSQQTEVSSHEKVKIELPQEKLALRVLDAWLAYQSRFSNLPGFQVCIRKKGNIIFSKAYGYADRKAKRRLKTIDLFHIASHSKTFTACAILQLVEQG